MSRFLFIAVVLIAISVKADTQTDSAVPARVRQSKLHQDQTIKQAEIVFLKAELAAKQAYLRDVKAGIADAMKAGNLTDATALKTINEQLDAEIADITLQLSGSEKKIVRVAANQGWQTAIEVKKGDAVQIAAKGTWITNTSDPKRVATDADGTTQKSSDFVPNSRYRGLIGQIGEQRFIVGKSLQFTAPDSGILQLRINDKGIDDNAGELVVTILIKH